MKLLLATSIKFPSPLANRMQVTEMARAYSDILGGAFYFGGRNVPDMAGRQALLVRVEGSKKSFLFAWRYLSAIEAHGITHVYCREKRLLFWILWYRMLSRRTRGVKFFYEEHARGERTWWYRFLLRHVEGVVCLTPIVERDVKSLVPSLRTIVLPHGVDASRFDIGMSREEARAALRLGDGFIASYIGSLTTMRSVEKGIDMLVDALSILGARGVRVIFCSIGASDADRAVLETRAREKGVQDMLRTVGRVSQETVARYQKASDALLLPLPPNEYVYMIPLKIFEYMASGTPTIASDLPSLEGVFNADRGTLVEPNNAQALASAIESVQKDPKQYRARAERARAYVKEKSWRARAERVLAFMQAV